MWASTDRQAMSRVARRILAVHRRAASTSVVDIWARVAARNGRRGRFFVWKHLFDTHGSGHIAPVSAAAIMRPPKRSLLDIRERAPSCEGRLALNRNCSALLQGG